jgi:hypothetical protein
MGGREQVIFGPLADKHGPKSKYEYRSTKQAQMTEARNSKPHIPPLAVSVIRTFENSALFWISDLVLRV